MPFRHRCAAPCSWASQEEAFKKRISQLEWNEDMYSTLQTEKDSKVGTLCAVQVPLRAS